MICKLKDLYHELAHDESLEMPIRLFQLFCLVVTVLTLFVILPVNLFQNPPILVNIGEVLLGLFAFFCFWECTRGRHHQFLFLIVMVLLMEPVWFLNSGTNGSITFYFLAMSIYPMVMFRGLKRWTLTVCMIFNICALLAIDYFLPSLTVPFRGPSDRVLDLISGAFCSSLGLVMIVWVVISSYDRERERTDKYARDLAEAHNKLERTLAAIPDLMFETDVEGRIYDYYAPATEALHAQPEAFLGKLVEDVFPPAAADVILKALTQAAAEGLHCGATYALDLPGGRRWFEISIATKPSDSAPDARLVVLARNITERKQAEEKLGYITKAVESTSEAIGISDSRGRHFYQNKALSDLFEYATAEELQAAGGGPAVVKDPEVAKEMFNNIMHGKPWAGELEMVTKSGRVFPAYERADAITDPEGNIIGLIGIITDITERKRAENLVRGSEVKYRTLVEMTGTGYLIIDSQGRVLDANQEYVRLSGHGALSEILGRSVIEWTAGAAKQRNAEAVAQCAKDGFIRNFVTEYVDAKGRATFVEINASVEGKGESLRIVSLCRDITERKNAAEELKRLRLHLWHADQVAQTTAVTASLAHELNQPLAAILTNAEVGLRFMTEANPDLKEIREIFADIIRDDERAGAVVSGLRDLLRQQETRSEKIDLADTIRGMIELLHSELLDKQVQLYFYSEPSSPVLADKAQVRQVILNIVINAIEAMQSQPAGQRRLELTIRHIAESEVLVAFRDSGPGIPEDMRERIFEAFWTTKQDGLGVGLMISRSIIESHNGRLWFANNPDNGVTFYFTLPLMIDPGHIELEADR